MLTRREATTKGVAGRPKGVTLCHGNKRWYPNRGSTGKVHWEGWLPATHTTITLGRAWSHQRGCREPGLQPVEPPRPK